jgi:hypothetical protein
MDRIEYFKERKNALRFIYNNRTASVETFLSNNDKQFLTEFTDMGFIEVDNTTNTYEITRLGKDYVDEFYN